MSRAVFLGLLGFVWLVGSAAGQSGIPLSNPAFGSTNDTYKRHYAPTGKPCLTLSGHATAQIVNKQMFDDRIDATNDCVQQIKVQACYYHTDHCIVLEVPPYGHTEGMLGIRPDNPGFRFEYKEQF